MINKLSLDQLIELFFIFKIAMQEEAEVKIILINKLAKDDESLLIKVLEQFELNDVNEKLYKKLDSDSDGYDAVSYLILEKSNIALRNLMQSPQDKKEELAEPIKDYLKVLLDIYEHIAAHPKYGKKASEFVGMTIRQACELWCKDIFVEYFESINNTNYKYIKNIAPLHALEGFGYYLRVLGCENPNLARQLGVEYAEAKSGKNKSQINNEPPKLPESKIASSNHLSPNATDKQYGEEIEFLRNRVNELEEENKKLKERTHDQTQDKTSASEQEEIKEPKKAKLAGNYPGIFAHKDQSSIAISPTQNGRKRTGDITPLASHTKARH